MKRVLIRSTAFDRDLRKWLKSNRGSGPAIIATLDALSEDATNPSLEAHKLKGSQAGHMACSAGYDIRITFRFVQHEGAEAILLLALGTHDEVYRRS